MHWENLLKEKFKLKSYNDAKADYEYERCGAVNIFMANEPLRENQHVKITERKTKAD